jgi:hypothetical protein
MVVLPLGELGVTNATAERKDSSSNVRSRAPSTTGQSDSGLMSYEYRF